MKFSRKLLLTIIFYLIISFFEIDSRKLKQEASIKIGGHTYEYNPEQNLSEGSFGTVYEAKRTGEKKGYALKISKDVSHGFELFKAEDTILKALNNCPDAKNSKRLGLSLGSVVEQNKGYIVYDLYNSSLDKRLKNTGILLLLKWINQIAEGLSILNKCGIVHFDLKPDNICITNKNDAVIIDFGLSELMNNHDKSMKAKGNLISMSPRTAKDQFCKDADVWGFAMLCFNILTGKNIYEEAQSEDPIYQFQLLKKNDLKKKYQQIVDNTKMQNKNEKISSLLEQSKNINNQIDRIVQKYLLDYTFSKNEVLETITLYNEGIEGLQHKFIKQLFTEELIEKMLNSIMDSNQYHFTMTQLYEQLHKNLEKIQSDPDYDKLYSDEEENSSTSEMNEHKEIKNIPNFDLRKSYFFDINEINEKPTPVTKNGKGQLCIGNECDNIFSEEERKKLHLLYTQPKNNPANHKRKHMKRRNKNL